MQHLDTTPDVGQRIAEILVAELGGDDLGRFASARHLASWVGLCPGQNESAGKQGRGTTRKGNRWRAGRGGLRGKLLAPPESTRNGVTRATRVIAGWT
jgi:hypothetical protein